MSRADVYVLGVHSSHDASVCLLRNGEIVCAIEKERLTRTKHDWGREGLEVLARYCLDSAGIGPSDLSYVVASEINNVTGEVIFSPMEYRITHHLAHAWAAVGMSGFRNCAVMVLDGEGSRVGELNPDERAVAQPPVDFYSEKESHYAYEDGTLTPLSKSTSGRGHESKFSGTDGLGSPYWYLSQLFFGREHCESKAMGLAAYGTVAEAYTDILTLLPEGRVRVAEDWIFCLDLPSQDPAAFYDEYANLAASVQSQLEAALVHKARWLRDQTKSNNLCFAGGVALNCVANSVLANAGVFPNVFVPFGPGDSSVSIGCAYYGWHILAGGQKSTPVRSSPFLGRRYAEHEVAEALAAFSDAGLVNVSPGTLSDVVDCVECGDVAAFFHGRSEFGPRALGNRSILADPRRHGIRDVLNSRVKYREPFRPFAAAILADKAAEWFEDVPPDADHMQYVARICAHRADEIPGVAHVDGTSRVQLVRVDRDSLLFEILQEFERRTGMPILLNTSFNVQEPIVETPFDALKTFVSSRMDLLYLQGHIVRSVATYRDTLPTDLGNAVLLWHQDFELVANLGAGTFGIVATGGRERSIHQGWHRTVAVHGERTIRAETFELLRALRPRRNAILPLDSLRRTFGDETRADFDETLLPARFVSVVEKSRS